MERGGKVLIIGGGIGGLALLTLRMTPIAVLQRQLRDLAQSGIASLPTFSRAAD